MATEWLGLKNTYEAESDNGDDPVYPGDEIDRLHNAVDTQLRLSVEESGTGVLWYPDNTSLLVADDGGLSVTVQPGRARVSHTTYGPARVELTDELTLDSLTPSTTLYVFVTIDVDSENDSRATGIPIITVQEGSTLDGGVVLASITTDTDSVTGVTDLRVPVRFQDVDIHGQTAETVPANNDEVLIYDASAGKNKRMSRSDFLDGVGGGVVPSGTGFRHVTSDVEDGTAKQVENADVADDAAIAESKIAFTDDAAAATASRRTLGTGATQAAAGNHTHSDATSSVAGFLSAAFYNLINNATNAATALAFMRRDSNGRAQVATPSADADIATKGYVDGVAIAAAADASTSTKGITKISVAPADATSPIAVGTNDPRVTDFIGPGVSHKSGLVPDFGATPHSPVWVLREDGPGPSPGLDRANHTGTQAQSTVTDLVTDLAAKAPLASPTLTGTPAAPTPAAGTNTTQIATTAFVKSEDATKADNLVANGYAQEKSNFNFSEFVYEPTESPRSGSGSFKLTSAGTTGNIAISDGYIPVDTRRTYRLSVWMKTLNLVANNNYAYAGLACYDIDKNLIRSRHAGFVANTHTTLAADLDEDDTTIVLTDASNWKNSSSDPAHQRHMIIWGYENDGGFVYPDYTYSRHTTQNHAGYADYDLGDNSVGGAWAGSGISGNTITLAEPWPASLGNWPAGTVVSNNQSGRNYLYCAAENEQIPETWTEKTGTIGGVTSDGSLPSDEFPPGTAFVRVVIICNRDADGVGGTAGNVTAVADVSLTVESTASGSGHTIEDEGTPLTARTSLNFTGAGVSVADSGGKTVVTIGGGSGYSDPAFISGLKLEYVSTTQIKVKSGACYIEDDAAVLEATSDTTLTPTLGADTWYHIYGYEDTGALAFESSTTAPAAPYRGTARSKTGDDTRRYIGSFITDGSSNIINVDNFGTGNTITVLYRNLHCSAPVRVLSGGSATSKTTIPLSGAVPVSSRMAYIRVSNFSTQQYNDTELYNSDSTEIIQGVTGMYEGGAPGIEHFNFPLNSSQEMEYKCPVASGSVYIDVRGYTYER